MNQLIHRIRDAFVSIRTSQPGVSFEDAASQCLESHRLDIVAAMKDFFPWLISQERLPKQLYPQPTFSDLPVSLAYDEKHQFCIDVYVWRHSDTSVHDHGFHGAFMVVGGNSLQTTYSFDTQEVIEGNRLEIGERAILQNTLLKVGEIVRIEPEKRFIHSVIHLTKPTLTFIIRSTNSVIPLKQYAYHSLYRNRGGFFMEHVEKRIQVMKYMLATDATFDHRAIFKDTKADDFVRLLHAYYALTRSKAKVLDIVESYASKHGEWLQVVMKSIQLDEWDERMELPKITEEPELLLAALLTRGKNFAEIQRLMGELGTAYSNPDFIFQSLRKICTEEISRMNMPEIGFDMLPMIVNKTEGDDERFLRELSENGWHATIAEQKQDILKLKHQIQTALLFKSLLH